MKLWTAPQLTLLGMSSFTPADHLPVDLPDGNVASSPELLIEYAGRVCYMSQRNPANRTTAEYLENILQHAHGSVLEHATFHLLIEGVSRSLTHELVRHRAGVAISQLSQRYVDASDTDFVVPPLMLQSPTMLARFAEYCTRALVEYDAAVMGAEVLLVDEPSAVTRRKRARESARAVLPNATETKLVWTVNGRALRHILAMRGDASADLEIQRFAVALYDTLLPHARALLVDFVPTDTGLTCTYAKV